MVAKYHVEQAGKIGKFAPHVSSDSLTEIAAWLDANAEWRNSGTTGEYQARCKSGCDLVLSEIGLVTSPDGEITRAGRKLSAESRSLMSRVNPAYIPNDQMPTREQRQAEIDAAKAARTKWATCADAANECDAVTKYSDKSAAAFSVTWIDGTVDQFSDEASALAAMAAR